MSYHIDMDSLVLVVMHVSYFLISSLCTKETQSSMSGIIKFVFNHIMGNFKIFEFYMTNQISSLC